MARKKATGVFIVTGYQAEGDEAVPGFEFAQAGDAVAFATKMHKTAVRLWAKIEHPKDKEARKEAIKGRTSSLGCDVLIQRTDSDGKHVGDPLLYSTIGVDEEVIEEEETETEETEESSEESEEESEEE